MELKERIRKRIAKIPASSGGMIDLYPSTLDTKLSPALLDKIVEEVMKEIDQHDRS